MLPVAWLLTPAHLSLSSKTIHGWQSGTRPSHVREGRGTRSSDSFRNSKAGPPALEVQPPLERRQFRSDNPLALPCRHR
jgi:hypothetical protein